MTVAAHSIHDFHLISHADLAEELPRLFIRQTNATVRSGLACNIAAVQANSPAIQAHEPGHIYMVERRNMRGVLVGNDVAPPAGVP